MSKSTFKILFYLRKNYLNKEGKAGIMIRLSLNGEISQFSSKLDIEPDKWDTTLGKAKGNTQKARQGGLFEKTSRTISRVMSLDNHLSNSAVTGSLKRPT